MTYAATRSSVVDRAKRNENGLRRTALSLVSTGYAVGMSLYIAGVTLALFGAIGFVGGATTAAWPIWAAGLIAVCSSVLIYRP